MVKSKHTPGPWKAARRGAYRDMNGQSRVIMGDDMRIAVVHHHKTDRDEANVSLIEAAPDLLDALEFYAQAWRSVIQELRGDPIRNGGNEISLFKNNVFPSDTLMSDMGNKARAAIAKAKGEI